MRAMFGLAALLVGVGVMFYVFTKNTADTLRVAKPMQDQAQQMSGRGQDGRSAMNSFKADPQMQGNKLHALLVTEVAPGGAADTFYGLKKGDQIIEISTNGGMQRVSDASNNDPEMAKAMLVQGSFEASLPIIVQRDGQQLTLPASAAPAVTNAPAANPALQQQARDQPAQAPAQPPPAERGNVHSQVDSIIKRIPGQQ
jgi:hypothetical protein